MSRPWKVLLVTSVAVFMSFLDATIVNIAFPDIERSFPDASLGDLSWILNAYNIVFAALLVPAGKVADIVGRRKMFFVGLWTFLAASALCAFAPERRAAGRRARPAGGRRSDRGADVARADAARVPAGQARDRDRDLGRDRRRRRRHRAVARRRAGRRHELALGLPRQPADRHPRGLPGAPAAGRAPDESAHRALPDAVGVVLLTAAVGLLSLGIVKGPDWNWDDRVIGSAAAGVVLLVAFFLRSRRHAAPVIELSLFRIRSFAVASTAVFVFAVAFYALLLNNVLFLTQVWDYSVLEAGFAVTAGPLTAAVFAVIGGKLSDAYGQRVVAVPGGLIVRRGRPAAVASCRGPSPTTGATSSRR